MRQGKKQHKANWIFHSMETKPDYMKTQPKPKSTQNRQKKSSFEDLEGFASLDDSFDN